MYATYEEGAGHRIALSRPPATEPTILMMAGHRRSKLKEEESYDER
jgi:hypothetical protein